MKLTLKSLAGGVALALTAQAHAFVDPAETDVSLFVSGASAPSNMLREHMVQNVCSQTAPIDVFVDVVDAKPSTPADITPIVAHDNFWTVQCEANAALTQLAAGTKIAIYKTDQGGSGQGTTPVVNAEALPFLDTGHVDCSLDTNDQAHNGGGTFDLYECGEVTKTQRTDFGVSDIEPDKFTGQLAPASGNFVEPGNWEVKPGPGLVFAPVFTKNFRDALQDSQGLCTDGAGAAMDCGDAGAVACSDGGNADHELEVCMPTVPSSYVHALYTGQIDDWNDESILGVENTCTTCDPTTPPQFGNTTNRVHVCRRVQGSGTHAEFMIHFERTNCTDDSRSMVTQPGGGFLGDAIVWETSSSGTLGDCLDALATGSGFSNSNLTPNTIPAVEHWATGYQSTEKNTGNTEAWRYLKVDGLAPSIENAFNGMYDQIYFLSFQHRPLDFKSGGVGDQLRPVAQPAADIEKLADNAFSITGPVAAQINETLQYTWGPGGFLVPSAPGVPAPVAFDPANPVTDWKRVNTDGGPNSCQPLSK